MMRHVRGGGHLENRYVVEIYSNERILCRDWCNIVHTTLYNNCVRYLLIIFLCLAAAEYLCPHVCVISEHQNSTETSSTKCSNAVAVHYNAEFKV